MVGVFVWSTTTCWYRILWCAVQCKASWSKVLYWSQDTMYYWRNDRRDRKKLMSLPKQGPYFFPRRLQTFVVQSCSNTTYWDVYNDMCEYHCEINTHNVLSAKGQVKSNLKSSTLDVLCMDLALFCRRLQRSKQSWPSKCGYNIPYEVPQPPSWACGVLSARWSTNNYQRPPQLKICGGFI